MIKWNNKLTFIDLFVGFGGLGEGFLQTNRFEALAYVEWKVPMLKTYRNRVIIIGVNNSSNMNLEDLYNVFDTQKKKNQPLNVFGAISHLPKFKPLKKMEKTNGEKVSHELIGTKIIEGTIQDSIIQETLKSLKNDFQKILIKANQLVELHSIMIY
jgi:site-specific DNA-cytosine methylase